MTLMTPAMPKLLRVRAAALLAELFPEVGVGLVLEERRGEVVVRKRGCGSFWRGEVTEVLGEDEMTELPEGG